ncbi:UPF0764 protein C16orf89 homolog [Rhineura floridana]|uniref:UPF0764 protein C16orf89 homolog n=1 Tax=Rhineura floridana TaxID=261503 RepID=UPI002AC85373|nr:UPF0764 protein C16orf89 homolog [Rhineura floridana]
MIHRKNSTWTSSSLSLSRCEDRRNSVISALEKAAVFLEDQYKEINIDAAVGYCLMQAYLSATLDKWASEPGLDSERKRVALLDEKVLPLIEKAKQALNQKDPAYSGAFFPSLSPGFWKVPHQWTQTVPSFPFSPTNGSCLDLKTSDSCISFLLGTRGKRGKSCLVPDGCRSIMTKAHCSGYSLSHQLFYFLFAEMKGCSDPLFHNAQYYKSAFCHLMMQSNLNIKKRALFHDFGDLFTENILFCGMAGFSDFYKPQWLDLILNWQKQDKGCFWMYESSMTTKESQRVKRSEKILPGECSAHNTAVAVGAIGGFLYYGF